MNRIRYCALIVLVGAILPSSAAAGPVVLHADFDTDTVGSPPATDLAGGPDEDTLRLYTDGGPITVMDHYGVMNQQPLVLERQKSGGFGVNFFVDPDYRDCGVYTIRWKSMLLTNVQFFYLGFHSPNSKAMGSVEFRPLGLMTANGSFNELASVYTARQPQEFEVRLDISNGTMDVTVDGVPDPQGQGLRHHQVGGTGLRAVAISFGMLDHYTVIFDDLHVTAEGCPGVPTETRNWGAVKALYR